MPDNPPPSSAETGGGTKKRRLLSQASLVFQGCSPPPGDGFAASSDKIQATLLAIIQSVVWFL